MNKIRDVRSSALVLAVTLAVLLASPQAGVAQLPLPLPLPSPLPSPTPTSSSVSGSATALQATVFGITTALASTGSLADDADARAAGLVTGSITGVGGAEVLNAAALSSIDGVADDYVSSAASLGNLVLSVAGATVSAAFVMSEAVAPVGANPTGWSTVEGLAVNGVPIALTGTVGETISLAGLTIVVNEIISTASGITVNALHITAPSGLVDVVVGSATAGISF